MDAQLKVVIADDQIIIADMGARAAGHGVEILNRP